MIRRPPRSTHCISSAASDVYKRQAIKCLNLATTIGNGNFNPTDQLKKSYDYKGNSGFDNCHKSLSIWSGFTWRILQFQQQLHLSVDTTPYAFTKQNCLEILRILQKNKASKIDINSFFIDKIVRVNYYQKTIHYKIIGIAHDQTPKSLFTPRTEQGSDKPQTQISYIQFYKQNYKKIFLEEDLDQPLFQVTPLKVSKKFKNQEQITYIPPQFLQIIVKNNTFKHYSYLSEHITCLYQDSVIAQNEFEKYAKLMNDNLDFKFVLNGWNIALDLDKNYRYPQKYLDPGQLVVQGQEIGLKQLIVELNYLNLDSRYAQIFKSYDGKVKINPFKITNWQFFMHEKDYSLVEEFTSKIYMLGYNVPKPVLVKYQNQDCSNWLIEMGQQIDHDAQIIVVVINDDMDSFDFYRKLKQLISLQNGISSQFICAKTIRKAIINQQIDTLAMKIMAQISTKTGNYPWTLSNLPLSDLPTVVAGLNVFNCKDQKHIIISIACSQQVFFQVLLRISAVVKVENEGKLFALHTHHIGTFKKVHGLIFKLLKN
eukprot:TRINITY_DN6067_c0_g1_i3.p1 TRINITY_DN6067_c0_g1~~TRINITY_DN6067_c0_g1_i3.p1  ORF type:complete len:540 (-),score=77.98 TRINITY_DN6067_c0_g1_i3:666-2285(-)